MKLSKFKQDVNSSEKGQWVDLGDGCKVKVARIGCKAYNDCIKQLSKPYQQQIRNKTLPDAVFEEIIIKALAETILLDWKGLEDDSGEIPYSKDKAYEILKDPAYKDFSELVSSLANEQETFRAEEIEASVKN